MRSLVRETVFKFIYSKLFKSDNEGLFDALIKDFSLEDKQFATELLEAYNKTVDANTEKLAELSTSYKLERIYSVDRCVILLGMAELDCFKLTPTIVIIDEAVKLSAKYSTENSVNYVNGILATYASSK